MAIRVLCIKMYRLKKCTGCLCGKFTLLNAFLGKHKRLKINEIKYSVEESRNKVLQKKKRGNHKMKTKNYELDKKKITA